MEIFKEILDTHTKICTCRKIYNINEDLEITVDQKENKVVMWGFNHKSDRFLNLSTKRFQKLMDGFKSVASDLYSSGNYYYITVDTSKKESRDDKSYEVEIEELKQKIDCLNDIIARLEKRNERLEEDVEKYRKDYLYYFNGYLVIDIIAFTDRDDEFENLVLNCIKNRDTKEKEIFDLILKDSITRVSVRKDSISDYVAPIQENYIRFGYLDDDDIDVINKFNYSEYDKIIGNIDFSNYSVFYRKRK